MSVYKTTTYLSKSTKRAIPLGSAHTNKLQLGNVIWSETFVNAEFYVTYFTNLDILNDVD